MKRPNLSVLLLAGLLWAASSSMAVVAPRADSDRLPEQDRLDVHGRYVFDEFNFRIKAPPVPWVPINIKSINPEGTIGFNNIASGMFFMIIAEEAGTGDEPFSSDSLAEIGISNLRTGSSKYRQISREPYEVHDLPGIHMVSEATIGLVDLTVVHWFYSHNGFFYQLLISIPAGREPRDQFIRDADKLLEGFEQIDPDRLSIVSREESFAPFNSPSFGYSLKLDRAGWLRWAEILEELPSGEVGGQRTPDIGFVIIPVAIGPVRPSLDGLATKLLAEMAFEFPGSEILSASKFEDGPIRGYTINAERTIEELDYIYRMRILQTREHGYLIAVWRMKSAGDPLELLDELLAGFTVDSDHPASAEPVAGALAAPQANILNELGLYHMNHMDFPTAKELFERAFAMKPSDSIMLANWIGSVHRLSGPIAALEIHKQHAARFEDDLGLQSWEPFLLAEVGEPEAAVEAYEKLFARGYRSVEDFILYTNALNRLEQYDKAIAFLSARYVGPPFESELAIALADTYYIAEQPTETIRITDQLFEQGIRTTDVYFLRANAQYALASYREAKETMEEASRLHPANEELGQFLAHISGMLGEGDSSALKTVIEPVPLPEGLLADSASTAIPAEAEDFGAYHVHRIIAIAFTPDEEYRSTERILTHVLDKRGAAQLQTLTSSYDPFTKEVHINSLRVLDSEGKLLHEVDQSDFYLVDDTSRGMFDQLQTIHLPVSGLEPGRMIELTVTRRWKGPPSEFPWFQMIFADSLPAARTVVLVSGAIDRVAQQASKGVKFERSGEHLVWEVRDSQVSRREPYGDYPAKYLPTLSLGDLNSEWKKLGSGYLGDIADTLEPDQAVTELAERLLQGIESPEQRVRRLVEHVQSDFEYQAVAFGRRAWKPNPPAKIINKKFGDCKDHSLLLYQLLRDRGIEARLALANTENALVPEIASTDQFNHMIVFLPGAGEGKFIDVTDKSHDVIELPPASLGGSKVLVLDEENSELKRIPEYPRGSYTINSRSSVTIAEDGRMGIEESLSLDGYAALYLRASLRNRDSMTQQAFVQAVLAAWLPTAQIEELSIENLEKPSSPLLLEMKYSVSGRMNEEQGKIRGRAPIAWERWLLNAPHVERRLSSVILYPGLFSAEVHIRPPAGYKIAAGLAPKNKGKNRFFEWNRSSEVEDGGLILHYRLERLAYTHPATAYDQFRQSAEELLNLFEPTMVFE